MLERLEGYSSHRKARNRPSMASEAFRLLLDKAIAQEPARPARKGPGIQGSDPKNGSLESPLCWGAPRVHGELLKLGIEISERTVSRWMPKKRKPPLQSWRSFLNNHVSKLVSIDFFTVPSATFRVLFVLIVLAHDRRKIVHFNVTEYPTAEWTARQLVQAFHDLKPPRYLIRDRDGMYGLIFGEQLRALEIEEVVIAPRSPWQSPCVERVIGTLRRECLDHVVILGEGHLRRIIRQFLTYYHGTRTHLALDKDAPERRSVQPSESGTVIEIPQVGGLHHRYERRAA